MLFLQCGQVKHQNKTNRKKVRVNDVIVTDCSYALAKFLVSMLSGTFPYSNIYMVNVFLVGYVYQFSDNNKVARMYAWQLNKI